MPACYCMLSSHTNDTALMILALAYELITVQFSFNQSFLLLTATGTKKNWLMRFFSPYLNYFPIQEKIIGFSFAQKCPSLS